MGGLPTRQEIARECGAVEEQLQPGGTSTAALPAVCADAVACTVRWMYGQTTTHPSPPHATETNLASSAAGLLREQRKTGWQGRVSHDGNFDATSQAQLG